MTKYRAKPTMIDGYRFASKREAKRYTELRLLERGLAIENLELQPAFDITVNGMKVCRVIPDFRYFDRRTGETIVEDVKSPITAKNAVYRLKKKLLKACHGIEVIET